MTTPPAIPTRKVVAPVPAGATIVTRKVHRMRGNPPKLYIIAIIIVCATVLAAIGRIESLEWVAVVGPFGGYLVGNGVAAAKGEKVQPAIGRQQDGAA